MKKKLLMGNGAMLAFAIVSFLYWGDVWIALIPLTKGAVASAVFVFHKKYPNRWTVLLFSNARHCCRVCIVLFWYCAFLGKIPPRFIPNCRVAPKGTWRLLFQNSFFQLHANNAGQLRINDRHGKPILACLQYYSHTSHGKHSAFADVSVETATLRGGMLVIARGTLENELVEIRVSLWDDRPSSDWQVSTTFLHGSSVRRIAMLAEGAVPLTELYARNGVLHDKKFAQKEYWLDREGAKFGSGERVLWLYHVPEISSLQVSTPANQLWINLDYFMDHPSVRHPFRQDGTARWQDTSQRVCQAGEVLTRRFMLHAGSEPAVLPRLLFQPNGFLSTFIWTEHACHTAFPVHRALYFGSSEIAAAGDATAGFIFHGIPITKSVHYSNDTQMTNSGHTTRFPGPMTAMSTHAEFVSFVHDLARTGIVEICLHCRDPQSSRRDDLEIALRDMRDSFQCKSWIDHIWCRPDGNVIGAREAFSCEGHLAGTPGFAADLFERYGITYFWNNTHEYWGDIPTFCEVSLHCERAFRILNTKGPGFFKGLYVGNRSGFPLPIVWQTPWVSDEAYSWPTYQAEMGSRTSEDWNTLFAADHLQAFADEGMIYIAHAYPTWAGDENGCWIADADGILRIHPLFDAVLSRMGRFQAEKKIWFAVIKDALAYWVMRERVKLLVRADGSIELKNDGTETIRGFTIMLRERCDIHGVTPTWKSSARGELCWFDFPPNASAWLSPCRESKMRLAA